MTLTLAVQYSDVRYILRGSKLLSVGMWNEVFAVTAIAAVMDKREQ